MTAPAATRRTRKTSPRTRRRALRLPRLGWGWALIALVVFGIAKTWPVMTALAVVLAAIGLVIAARQPAWLQRATRRLPAIHFNRTRLPARGHRTLHAFQRMTPTRFEHAIAELALEDDNVHSATPVGGSGDGGLDVLVQLRNGTRILVQCKRYKNGNNVPPRDIRDANGAYRDLHHCHAAVIVTTSDFSQQAYQTNARFQHKLRLVNGADLQAWANGQIPPPW